MKKVVIILSCIGVVILVGVVLCIILNHADKLPTQDMTVEEARKKGFAILNNSVSEADSDGAAKIRSFYSGECNKVKIAKYDLENGNQPEYYVLKRTFGKYTIKGCMFIESKTVNFEKKYASIKKEEYNGMVVYYLAENDNISVKNIFIDASTSYSDKSYEGNQVYILLISNN